MMPGEELKSVKNTPSDLPIYTDKNLSLFSMVLFRIEIHRVIKLFFEHLTVLLDDCVLFQFELLLFSKLLVGVLFF